MLSLIILIGYSSCLSYAHAAAAAKPKQVEKQEKIVLLFDNDVHGHIEGYPMISAMRGHELSETPHVLVISLGDFAQGGVFCAVDKGIGITTLMNKAGYELVNLGNHEFDYGIAQLDTIIQCLKAEVVCCNFEDLRIKKTCFAPSTIRTFGNVRIGFVGMVAPLTETSDSPKSYYDADGKKIYSFHSGDLFTIVQREVDKLRAQGVDYVIALSHLGDNPFVSNNSIALINHTKGIDVVLDSHAHSYIPESKITNLKGDPVLMVSTGCWFSHIGKLTITPDRQFIPEMIDTKDFDRTDAGIALTIDSLRAEFDHTSPIAYSPFKLHAFEAETYDRNSQTNLGTLAADALRVTTGADIGWINAGGIRNSIHAGEIRFKDLIACFPFFNTICVAECTGQVILDALEYGVSRCPHDFGSFPQVSGIKYKLDTSIPTPVIMDVQERLIGIKPDAKRRISNVRILDPFTDVYEPIDPERTYSLASIDFLLKYHGAGDVFSKATITQDGGFNDVQNLEEYLVLELFGRIDERYEFVTKNMDE